MAETFYPSSYPSPNPSAPPVASPELASENKVAAEKFFDHPSSQPPVETKPEIEGESEPEKTLSEALYGESTIGENGTYARILKPGLELIGDTYGISAPDLDAHRVETSKIMAELEVEPAMADTLHTLYAHHVVKPADAETVQNWGKESRKMLRETYGADLESRVQTAMEYVKAKGMTDILNVTGLGSNPVVVKELVERAHRLKVAGKFPGAKK